MLKGEVRQNRPLISIVVGWKLGVQTQLALIDTGFTGELRLSEEKAIELGLEKTHIKKVEFGNGKAEYLWYAPAIVSLEGVNQLVDAMIAPGEVVIGVELMKKFEYILKIDFCTGRLTLS